MNSSPRIVISGLGAVCGAGRTVDAIWDAVQTGRSAVTLISHWDAARWPVHRAAEIQSVSNQTLVEDRKLHKFISRTDLFGLYAASAAIEQSGILGHRDTLGPDGRSRFNERTGVFAGSGGGNYQSSYEFFPLMTTAGGNLQTFGRELSSLVNPMWLLKNLPNNVLCHVGIRYGFKGANACITNQCVGGALAVAEAAASILAGEADQAAAIGHDSPIEPETVLHYHRFGLLSNAALRPFDRDRDGTVFGEGAAALVLETAVEAQARQAAPFGEFLGSGCATEGTGILDLRPAGDGLSQAIQIGLEDAGLSPGAVGMIVAHGNGTRASDASEAMAIRRVFGENPPPVTGFKWAYGHLIAASGVLDLVLTLTALQRGVVPGIPTLKTLDPDIAPFPVSSSPQKPRSDVALILSRGFGGMNVALLVRGVSSRSAG